ncbi:MAG: hypothetical protein RJB66_1968 [Pseudomonadota bacterium]|jgi:hypothetical protein
MEQKQSTARAFTTATFLSFLILFFQNCSPSHNSGKLSLKGLEENKVKVSAREAASQEGPFGIEPSFSK